MDSNSNSLCRSKLIEALADGYNHIDRDQVYAAVRGILDQMAEAVASGERIEIRGFGSFCLHTLPTRIARNPKSGEPVELPARHSVHFRPGKELRGIVNDSRNNSALE